MSEKDDQLTQSASEDASQERPNPRRFRWYAFRALALLIGAVIGELCCQAVLLYCYGASIPDEQRLHEYDETLGWRNIPNRVVLDRYGPRQNASHNSLGLRDRGEISFAPKGGCIRILCVGDSFTYGICGDEETYPAQLEDYFTNSEVVNMGVAGYGVDQAFLHYKRDGARFKSHLVVFAFIEDDFKRMSRRTFLTRTPKPLLRLTNGKLTIANTPVPSWGDTERSWFVRFPKSTAIFQIAYTVVDRLRSESAVIQTAEQLLKNLHNLSVARQQELVLLYLPTQYAGATDLSDDNDSNRRKWLRRFTKEMGLRYLDLTDEFRRTKDWEPYLQKNGHYNSLGNRLVARLMAKELTRLFPQLQLEPQFLSRN